MTFPQAIARRLRISIGPEGAIFAPSILNSRSTSVFIGQSLDSKREAEREAEDTKRKAPFPKLEAEALSKIQKALGKEAGLCLERAKDSVTKDGCFATELDFAGVRWLDLRSGKPMVPGREPAGVPMAKSSVLRPIPVTSSITMGKDLNIPRKTKS